MRKKRVLIVDTFAVAPWCGNIRLEPDFEISGEAENGRDAIQKAENLKPDLVILDLSMPVMSGLDAAPRLKQLLPGVRIILFTVEESNELDRLARAGGINAAVASAGGVQTGASGSGLAGFDRSRRGSGRPSQRQLAQTPDPCPPPRGGASGTADAAS